jgi:signal transduction histidine kinase
VFAELVTGWMGKLRSLLHRKLKAEDMFRRTQYRLTLQYSGILIVFLLIFISIAYGVFYNIIMRDQAKEAQAMAEQQAQYVQEQLRHNRSFDPRLLENQELVISTEEQLFSYLIGNNGQLLTGYEAEAWMRVPLLSAVQGWKPIATELRQQSLLMKEDLMKDKRRMPRGYKGPLQQNSHLELRVMLSGTPVKYGDQQVAMLYVGKNVSYHHELLKWLLYLLGGLGILFFGVGLYMSHLMSRRAMIPIMESYQRQREFIADASHELRTPLSVLMSSIQSMELEQKEEQEAYTGKLLGYMKDEVKRMTRMVSDLLVLARSDEAAEPLHRELFDAERAVDTVVEAMRPAAEAKDIRLHWGTTGQSMLILADAGKLKQLLYILLDNAIKYSGSGAEVLVTLAMLGNEGSRRLQLTVEDTGQGIDPSEQARIFDRFYRADKARNRQLGGHGLGLSIAKAIATAHQGSIQVSSVIGKGTKFTVLLPDQK